jgi:DNA repair exonuclease SbcCD nuclease subunit
MITILHAADLHLDSPFSGLAPDQAAKRRGEQRLLLDDLTALAKQEQADVVLLPGDLFDSAHVYPQTLRALARCLGEMPCPVFIAPGNHDPLTDTSPYTTMEWPENVHIFQGNVDKYPLPNRNCVVYGWGFPQSRVHASPLEGFLVNEGRDTVKLMCLHGDVSPNSPYCPIDPGQIAASGLTYLALGHIHSHSGLQRSGSTWYAYPGCPQGRGFDETGEKGVLVVKAEPGSVTARFVPLCRRRYEILTVDVTGKDPLHAVLAALPPDTAPHAYRILLTGECAGVDVHALTAALEPRFAALTVRDQTRLPVDLWQRRGEADLTGLVLDQLWRSRQAEPDNETLLLAARFALAAIEGGEDPAP